MTIESVIEPSTDGHGYIAIVKRDGKKIYESDNKHGRAGVFDSESLAQEHADAWADCERRMASEVERLKAARRGRFSGEVIVLKSQAHEQIKLANDLKKSAKTAEDNADKCEERIEELAQHAERPKVQIHWDRRSAGSVKLQAMESAWDEPLVLEEIDEQQMSLPGTNWQVTADDAGVSRAIGYGRVEVEIVDGMVKITLGADEHRLVGKLAGTVEHVDARKATATESEDEPEAKAKSSKPIEPKMGKLGDKELRDRLPHLVRAETLLGLYVLESARSKPRARVLTALTNLASDHDDPRLAMDVAAIADKRKSTALKPDRAAAALVSVSGDPDMEMLGQLAPVCGDKIVLGLLLDGELERGEASRDEVVTVLRQRIAEIEAAEPKPEDAANNAEESDDEPEAA
jgi:hypothetical protein